MFNWFITSGNKDVIPLSKDERRFFIYNFEDEEKEEIVDEETNTDNASRPSGDREINVQDKA